MADFPKDRGPRNLAGRSAARTLAGDDQWARKNRFGAVARNKGGWLEVQAPQAVQIDGYYALGSVNGEIHIMGSPTGRGTFLDRGVFATTDGFNPQSAAQIRPFGKGYGALTSIEFLGYQDDFNSKAAPTWRLSSFSTYTGKKITPEWNVQIVSPNTGEFPGYTGVVASRPPAVVNTEGPADWQAEAKTFVLMGEDDFGVVQYAFGYVYQKPFADPPVLSLTVMNTPVFQLPHEMLTTNLGPLSTFGLGSFLRPTYSQDDQDHPIDIAACPGLTGQFTNDGGLTWEPASSMAAFQEFYDTVQTIEAIPTNSDEYNRCVTWAGLQAVPVADNFAIGICVVPYIVGTVPTPFTQMGKVKLVLIDGDAKTVMPGITLYDGEYKDAFHYYSGGGCAVKGGAAILYTPQTEADYHDNHPIIGFTTDGVGMISSIPLPRPAWHVGPLRAIDKDTIGCVMFEPADGEYVWYASNDLGNTWTRRATVASVANGALAPTKVEEAPYLLEFSAVTQLRANMTPQYAEAGAPWASDARLDPPIL